MIYTDKVENHKLGCSTTSVKAANQLGWTISFEDDEVERDWDNYLWEKGYAPQKPQEIKEQEVRAVRDKYFEKYVDYYQSKPLLWAELTKQKRQEIANYRMYLSNYNKDSSDWYEHDPLTYEEWLADTSGEVQGDTPADPSYTNFYIQTLTTSGTWTKPDNVPDTAMMFVWCVGGGSFTGYEKSAGLKMAAPGGGGGCGFGIFKVSDLSSVSYTIGAGGTSSGKTGGNTTFDYVLGAGGSINKVGTTNPETDPIIGTGGFGRGLFCSKGLESGTAAGGFLSNNLNNRYGCASGYQSTPGNAGVIQILYIW